MLNVISKVLKIEILTENQLELNYHTLLLLMKTQEKFYQYTEIINPTIPKKKRFRFLFTLNFCLVLVFTGLVLSICSVVYQERLPVRFVSSLMREPCQIYLQDSRHVVLESGMMIHQYSQENLET